MFGFESKYLHIIKRNTNDMECIGNVIGYFSRRETKSSTERLAATAFSLRLEAEPITGLIFPAGLKTAADGWNRLVTLAKLAVLLEGLITDASADEAVGLLVKTTRRFH